jgi:hypothetical protein
MDVAEAGRLRGAVAGVDWEEGEEGDSSGRGALKFGSQLMSAEKKVRNRNKTAVAPYLLGAPGGVTIKVDDYLNYASNVKHLFLNGV